jgi:hypothetical protein
MATVISGPGGAAGRAPSIDELIRGAEQHQAAGNIGEAASICQRVLALGPDSAEALHILG